MNFEGIQVTGSIEIGAGALYAGGAFGTVDTAATAFPGSLFTISDSGIFVSHIDNVNWVSVFF